MAQQIFLQFVPTSGFKGEVKGEVQETAYKDFIQVESWHHSYENTLNIGSTTGGAGAGKAQFNEVTITKRPDRSTQGVLTALFTGAHFEKVIAVFRQSGNPATYAYLRIELELAAIAKYELSGDMDGAVETITIKAGAVRQSFTPQSQTGAAEKPLQANWSFVQNKALPPTP